MEWRPKVDYTRLIAGGFGGGTMIRFDFWPAWFLFKKIDLNHMKIV